MQLRVLSSAIVNRHGIFKNGKAFSRPSAANDPDSAYQAFNCNYPKFFKMDALCKQAWLAAEILLSYPPEMQHNPDGSKTGIVLATCSGSMQVDHQYAHTIVSVPSPALFVYTLPNVMLGEICIRHRINGEQMCLISANLPFAAIMFWASDMLQSRGMQSCLCGWAEASGSGAGVCLYHVAKSHAGVAFTSANMQMIYKNASLN